MLSELELLQEELKGKLKAQEPNIKEIVDKIGQVQGQLERVYESSEDAIPSSTAVIPSLEYYLTIVSDITKVIRGIIKTHKQISAEIVGKIIRGAET